MRLVNEKLLDLHLSQIKKHTREPFTIYASVNRLLPEFCAKLENHPNVAICRCPSTNARERYEHSFYLEHRVQRAINESCTYVATLHVDSFAVRSGWVEQLTEELSSSCVLSALVKEEVNDHSPSPACLLFHRGFYLKYRPRFLLSEEEFSSTSYKNYLREFPHFPDTGVGYGFRLYEEGLKWHSLQRSNRGQDFFTFCVRVHNEPGDYYRFSE